MGPIKLFVAVVVLWLAGLAAGGAAQASSVFTANAAACGYASETNATGVSVQALGGVCNPWLVADASAFAGSSGLGVHAVATHYCCASAAGAGGTAQAETEFVITGPPGFVEISLNLSLGFDAFTGLIDPGAESIAVVDLSATVAGVNYFAGQFVQRNTAGTLSYVTTGVLAPPGACAIPCILTTPTVVVNTNAPVLLSLGLSASLGGSTASFTGRVDAARTLYFPLDGPVFNLPEGYSAEIVDMNVVDNVVVPEPATFLQLACCLTALTLRRRR